MKVRFTSTRIFSQMTLLDYIQRASLSSAVLRFAADGPDVERQLLPVSLFAGAHQPQMTREDRLVELYDKQRPALLAYLCRMGLALSEAEDAVQDSFLRLCDHLEGGGDERNLRAWLYRVAHNIAIDRIREGSRGPLSDMADSLMFDAILASSSNPEEDAIRNEEIRRVQSALGRLTQQQRAAVLLRAEELRYREIAAVLGVSIKRASELIQRALVKLAGDS